MDVTVNGDSLKNSAVDCFEIVTKEYQNPDQVELKFRIEVFSFEETINNYEIIKY